MLNVIELSFIKHNLPIHVQTLNLSFFLWLELSIKSVQSYHQWGAQVSDQHISQFLDCHKHDKWNWNNSFTISEI